MNYAAHVSLPVSPTTTRHCLHNQKFIILTSYNVELEMKYWKRRLFCISWCSFGILPCIVGECQDISEAHTASVFRAIVGHMDAEVKAVHFSKTSECSSPTQRQKPKNKVQLIDNCCENRRTFIKTYTFVLIFRFLKSLTIHIYVLSCYRSWFLQAYLHKNTKIA
jgi:hypothetical protein